MEKNLYSQIMKFNLPVNLIQKVGACRCELLYEVFEKKIKNSVKMKQEKKKKKNLF